MFRIPAVGQLFKLRPVFNRAGAYHTRPLESGDTATFETFAELYCVARSVPDGATAGPG